MSGKKIIQGLQEAIAHAKGTDSLKERLLRLHSYLYDIDEKAYAVSVSEALAMNQHDHEQALRRAYIHGTRAGKVIPADDDAREKIWHEIKDAWPQLSDAMLSRLNEILWPNGITTHTSSAFQRPMRFYPDLVEVEVVPIEGKGRGVVALWPIKEGSVVETAPVKPFDHSQDLPSELADLPVAWTDDQDCIVMGVSQFVNHSDTPNCRLDRNLDDLTVSLVALRTIAGGEELTYKYKVAPWFEVAA